MNMLARLDGTHHSPDIMIVLDDGITLTEILQGDLMAEGDIHPRVDRKPLLRLHVEPLAAIPFLDIDHRNGYIITFSMNEKVYHSEESSQSYHPLCQ
jgi:hypothetical protein